MATDPVTGQHYNTYNGSETPGGRAPTTGRTGTRADDPLVSRDARVFAAEQNQANRSSVLEREVAQARQAARNGSSPGSINYESLLSGAQANYTAAMNNLRAMSTGGGGSSGSGSTSAAADDAWRRDLAYQELELSRQRLAAQNSQFQQTFGLQQQSAQGSPYDWARLAMEGTKLGQDDAFRYANLAQGGYFSGIDAALRAEALRNQTELGQNNFNLDLYRTMAGLEGQQTDREFQQWLATNNLGLDASKLNLQQWQSENQMQLQARQQALAEMLGQGDNARGWANLALAEEANDLKKLVTQSDIDIAYQRLGLDKYQTDVNAGIAQARLQIDAMTAQAQANAESARAAAAMRAAEIQYELGMGDLRLGQQKLEQAERFGLEDLAIRREELGLKDRIETADLALRDFLGRANIDLGRAQVETQRYGIDVDAATRREMGYLDSATSRYGTDVNAATDIYKTDATTALGREQLALAAQSAANDDRIRLLQLGSTLRGPRDMFQYVRTMRDANEMMPEAFSSFQSATAPSEAITLDSYIQDTGIKRPETYNPVKDEIKYPDRPVMPAFNFTPPAGGFSGGQPPSLPWNGGQSAMNQPRPMPQPTPAPSAGQRMGSNRNWTPPPAPPQPNQPVNFLRGTTAPDANGNPQQIWMSGNHAAEAGLPPNTPMPPTQGQPQTVGAAAGGGAQNWLSSVAGTPNNTANNTANGQPYWTPQPPQYQFQPTNGAVTQQFYQSAGQQGSLPNFQMSPAPGGFQVSQPPPRQPSNLTPPTWQGGNFGWGAPGPGPGARPPGTGYGQRPEYPAGGGPVDYGGVPGGELPDMRDGYDPGDAGWAGGDDLSMYREPAIYSGPGANMGQTPRANTRPVGGQPGDRVHAMAPNSNPYLAAISPWTGNYNGAAPPASTNPVQPNNGQPTSQQPSQQPNTWYQGGNQVQQGWTGQYGAVTRANIGGPQDPSMATANEWAANYGYSPNWYGSTDGYQGGTISTPDNPNNIVRNSRIETARSEAEMAYAELQRAKYALWMEANKSSFSGGGGGGGGVGPSQEAVQANAAAEARQAAAQAELQQAEAEEAARTTHQQPANYQPSGGFGLPGPSTQNGAGATGQHNQPANGYQLQQPWPNPAGVSGPYNTGSTGSTAGGGGWGGAGALPNQQNTSYQWNPQTGRMEWMPAYATGTNYVPRTGVALLHQGEAVIPANQNPAARGLASANAAGVPWVPAQGTGLAPGMPGVNTPGATNMNNVADPSQRTNLSGNQMPGSGTTGSRSQQLGSYDAHLEAQKQNESGTQAQLPATPQTQLQSTALTAPDRPLYPWEQGNIPISPNNWYLPADPVGNRAIDVNDPLSEWEDLIVRSVPQQYHYPFIWRIQQIRAGALDPETTLSQMLDELEGVAPTLWGDWNVGVAGAEPPEYRWLFGQPDPAPTEPPPSEPPPPGGTNPPPGGNPPPPGGTNPPPTEPPPPGGNNPPPPPPPGGTNPPPEEPVEPGEENYTKEQRMARQLIREKLGGLKPPHQFPWRLFRELLPAEQDAVLAAYETGAVDGRAWRPEDARALIERTAPGDISVDPRNDVMGLIQR